MLKISWAVYIKLTWWRLLHITAKWMHNDCASVFPLSIYKLLHYQHLHIHVGFLILCAILFSCLNRLRVFASLHSWSLLQSESKKRFTKSYTNFLKQMKYHMSDSHSTKYHLWFYTFLSLFVLERTIPHVFSDVK